MFLLYADKNELIVQAHEWITSGSVNVYPVQFEFSPDWDGLDRLAVFQAGEVARSTPLAENGACTIPSEVLQQPGVQLYAGVYGTREEEVVLPTVWAGLGTVLEGAVPGKKSQIPAPDQAGEDPAQKGDTLGYTPDGKLGLYAGDTLLSAVPISGGGTDAGTTDHRLLSHRDAEKQHPISAIDGLSEELSGKQDVLVPDGTLTMRGSSIGVATPVKNVTQAEYDALPEAEKRDVLFVVSGAVAPQLAQASIDEYDTDDGWHVRKWSNGYVELQKQLPFSGGSWATLGGVFHLTQTIPKQEFPFPLTKLYSSSAAISYLSNGRVCWLAQSANAAPLSNTAEYYVIAPYGTTNTQAGTVSYAITGLWR